MRNSICSLWCVSLIQEQEKYPLSILQLECNRGIQKTIGFSLCSIFHCPRDVCCVVFPAWKVASFCLLELHSPVRAPKAVISVRPAWESIMPKLESIFDCVNYSWRLIEGALCVYRVRASFFHTGHFLRETNRHWPVKLRRLLNFLRAQMTHFVGQQMHKKIEYIWRCVCARAT